MKELELLAIDLFNRFSLKQNGRSYDWNYLSRDRQIEWMKEVVINLEFVLDKVRGKIKLPPGSASNEAAYGAGFKDGLRTKHLEIMQVIDDLDQNLKAQLDQIINPPQE